MIFYPNSPRYQRGVFLASIYMCVIASTTVSMSDYGRQEHVLTGWQKFVNRNIDNYFGIDEKYLKEQLEKRKSIK